jgi:hypothetical protein
MNRLQAVKGNMTEKTATRSNHLLSEQPAKPFNENSI